MSSFKVKNVTVSTYNAEYDSGNISGASGFASLYLTRLSSALCDLSDNFSVINEAAECYTYGNGYQRVASVQLHNSVINKYIRMWFVAKSESNDSALTVHLCSTDSTMADSDSVRIHLNNILLGGYFSNNNLKYKIPLLPSGLLIGIASDPIDVNLSKDLHLDIPLFGFGIRNLWYFGSETYNVGYRYLTDPINYVIPVINFGSVKAGSYIDSSLFTQNFTYNGIHNFSVATDGKAFFITDNIFIGTNQDRSQCHTVFYATDMFNNFDENDLRTDGAVCLASGNITSYQIFSGIFYTDRMGNMLNSGSIGYNNLSNTRISSLPHSDTIYYTSTFPFLSRSSVNDDIAFSSSSPAKGMINTHYIRLVDSSIVKRKTTLDNRNWCSVLDGVLFPWSYDSPALV